MTDRRDWMPPPSDEYQRANPGWEAPPNDDKPNGAAASLLGEWDAGDDDAPIPPRGWLLGNIFCCGYVSSLIASGGVGKTALRHAQLLSLAAGRSLTGDHVFKRCRVLIISLEDGVDELRRRIRAAMLHHGIEHRQLKGWLYLAAPTAAAGKIMVVDDKGRPVRAALADELERVIAARKIDIVSLDPFVKSHSLDENANSAIDEVMQLLSDLATARNIAVDVPHHVNKGPADPGNANRGRGASSMKDAARLVYTLTPMSPEEAQAFGVPEAERRRLIRMDSGKVNIAPPLAEARWFRLIGVPLDNGNDTYPNGDDVQTVEPWTPPDAWAGLTNHLLNRILDDIDAGLSDGQRYSAAPNAKHLAAWPVILKHAPSKSEGEAREIIRTWVKNGVIEAADYENPVTRKPAKGLRVVAAKRPT